MKKFLSACAAHEPVLPPVRESQYPTHSILAKYYDFQEAFQEADVVAHIRIGDWLGEDIDRNATLFQAETVDVFKGTLPDTFVYDQFGCSGEPKRAIRCTAMAMRYCPFCIRRHWTVRRYISTWVYTPRNFL